MHSQHTDTTTSDTSKANKDYNYQVTSILPTEAWDHVFGYLKYRELSVASMVCSFFNSVVAGTRRHRKSIKRDYSRPIIDSSNEENCCLVNPFSHSLKLTDNIVVFADTTFTIGKIYGDSPLMLINEWSIAPESNEWLTTSEDPPKRYHKYHIKKVAKNNSSNPFEFVSVETSGVFDRSPSIVRIWDLQTSSSKLVKKITPPFKIIDVGLVDNTLVLLVCGYKLIFWDINNACSINNKKIENEYKNCGRKLHSSNIGIIVTKDRNIITIHSDDANYTIKMWDNKGNLLNKIPLNVKIDRVFLLDTNQLLFCDREDKHHFYILDLQTSTIINDFSLDNISIFAPSSFPNTPLISLQDKKIAFIGESTNEPTFLCIVDLPTQKCVAKIQFPSQIAKARQILIAEDGNIVIGGRSSKENVGCDMLFVQRFHEFDLTTTKTSTFEKEDDKSIQFNP